MAKTPSRGGLAGFRLARSRASRMVPASGLVDDLVVRIAARRQRPIELLAFALGEGSPSGLWVATQQADYIVFPDDASASERTAIICHEVAHMVLDHEPAAAVDRASQLLALVAPHIDPTVGRRFLTRHGYAEDTEAEAEELATYFVTRLARNAGARLVRQDSVSDRLR